ncbi:cryptochrome/photolyase family protein [Aquiluna borgnonia]|uniref:Cryptochrome/photolyase family protein n=1 Tax=Aquiluna borgnonia TaxID=2499157 RepID=A0A7D4Q707_9MICO|nr:cryptochrome/photolyase family protein [Aquiluna borgnonia]QKJ25702.1 cryptochrome/photolyase family protein [Aquiluna borgnonia]
MQLLLADQLGPHFELEADLLLPIVDSQFAKRTYHRQKAHLIRYAQLARAKDANVTAVRLESYRELKDHPGLTSVAFPSSRGFLALCDSLGLEKLPNPGFCSSFADWENFVAGAGKRLRLEDFYRKQRLRLGVLMDGPEPSGGQWNFDADNRLPPPKAGIGVPHPFVPVEDELDAQVRAELDELERSGRAKFMGVDGPRKFPATRSQALEALEIFIRDRLDLFGPYEDAMDKNDWAMSHSLLSVPMNLGLLSPLEVVARAEQAYRAGTARLESVEGFVRQIIGWRDYVWQLYWHFGDGYEKKNELEANALLPKAWADLDSKAISAKCLSHAVEDVNQNAWTHHIPRLMVLGNAAMQRGYNPGQVNNWFIDAFADGTPWVMPANVIGMSLYADGGMMSTKPYAAGGAYIKKMSNFCGDCPFDPAKRVGEDACPFTAGYWNFLHHNRERFSKNHRMSQPLAGLKRLSDLDQLVEQESKRESL